MIFMTIKRLYFCYLMHVYFTPHSASPENLESIVNSYDDRRIRYYKNEQNLGGKDLVSQWNNSIAYARGEYLILASDDDVYSPLYLEKMDALTEKYPNKTIWMYTGDSWENI